MSTKNKKRSRAVKPKKQIKEKGESWKWGVRINDGFCEYEYIFTGRNDTSIQQVAEAVGRHLEAKITTNGTETNPIIMPVFRILPE